MPEKNATTGFSMKGMIMFLVLIGLLVVIISKRKGGILTMRLRIFILFCCSILMIPFNSVVFAEVDNGTSSKLVSVKNFNESQISDDVLTEKALNGDLINNAYTTVNVEERPEDNTTVVEIDRVISEKVYDNGEIITENQKTVTTIVNDEVLYSLAGSKEETTKPASSNSTFAPLK